MKFKNALLIMILFIASLLNGQTITGTFPALRDQWVKLTGLEGFGTYAIDSVRADSNGQFALSFKAKDHGMGYLSAQDKQPYLVVLSGENIRLAGELLSLTGSVKVLEGSENLHFARYAREQPRRQQILSAWEFLSKNYQSDSLFMPHQAARSAIQQEMDRIHAEDQLFLSNLGSNFYMSWFLPVRKLVANISYVAQYKTEDIPATIAALRSLDYANDRFWKSGLYKETLEGHYWLIENSGKPLDSVFVEMNISTDSLVSSLSNDEDKLNKVTNYLFGLLERHSLFEAAEYLSVRVLTQNSCSLTDNLTRQLETYRAMKKGNIAPDILLEGDVIRKNIDPGVVRLSGFTSKKTLVVFGSSWCPNCKTELSKLAANYDLYRKKGVEVLFVSLDTDPKAYREFVKNFPFTSMCDFQKWDARAAKDYYVIGTPTMFLLDAGRKILLRPNSVDHLTAWLESNP